QNGTKGRRKSWLEASDKDLGTLVAGSFRNGDFSSIEDDATCQTIWQMASPNGATISQDQAVPYIVNFKMVDVDGDGAISADEFKAGCGKGLVKNPKP